MLSDRQASHGPFWLVAVLFHLRAIPLFPLPVQAEPSCAWRGGCYPSVNLPGDSFQVKMEGRRGHLLTPTSPGAAGAARWGKPGGNAAASSARSPRRARARPPSRGFSPCRPRERSWEPLGVEEPRLRPRWTLARRRSGAVQPGRHEVGQALMCAPVNWRKGGVKCAPSLILAFNIRRGQQSV